MVAPNADVDANFETGKGMVGSVFAKRFELDQGRRLRHVPFASDWTPDCDGFVDCS